MDGYPKDGYVSARDFKKHMRVCTQTLRKWAATGKVDHVRTAGGVRRYKLPRALAEPSAAARVVYIRVSSPKQRDDLERQRHYMVARFPDYEVVEDIGSGIDWKRRGLLSLLERSLQGGLAEVVVASRDRLCRFAFELLEWLFQRHGTKLTALDSADGSPEQELSDDLLSIVQVFCCKRNGKRRYAHRQSAQGQAEPDHGPEGPAEEVRARRQVLVQ